MSLRPRASVSEPAVARLATDEPIAFDHEHSRLYDALERAAQLAEIASHGDIASALRILRGKVAADITRGRCEDIHG